MPTPSVQGSGRLWEHFTPGAKAVYQTPDDLWAACLEYFRWNEDNPLYEAKIVSYMGKSVLEHVPKMRAMTIKAMALKIGVNQLTWNRWRKERPDLHDVMDAAESVIFTQKFTGAAADLLNGRIIARDLGLAEMLDHKSSDGSMSPGEEKVSAREIILDRLSKRAARAGTDSDTGGSDGNAD